MFVLLREVLSYYVRLPFRFLCMRLRFLERPFHRQSTATVKEKKSGVAHSIRHLLCGQ